MISEPRRPRAGDAAAPRVKRRQRSRTSRSAHDKINGCDPGYSAAPRRRSERRGPSRLRRRPRGRFLPVPPAGGARRPRPDRPLRPGEEPAPQAPRDRRAPRAGARTGAGREARRGRGRRLRQPLPRPRSLRRRARREPARGPRRPPSARARDRGAHEHQPQQGRAHRPHPQRLPGRHVRAPAAPPRLRRRRAELHRRHGRAGGGRGGGLPAPRGKDPRRRREDRREVRLLLLGPLREGGRLLRRLPGEQGAPGRGPPRDRGGRERHRAPRRARGAPHRGLPPRLDGPARDPLRPARARERHPPPALLGPRLRAAEGEGRRPPAGGGQERRLLGAAHGRGRRRDRRGQDHRPLERHRHLHRQGHRLPALEAREAGPRLPLPPVPDRRRRPPALDDDERRGRRRAPRRSVTRGRSTT